MYLEARISNEPMLGPSVVVPMQHVNPCMCDLLTLNNSQVKSSHLYLYSAFNNTDCVNALNSIKLEDRVSVMYNNKIKHSIFS